MKNWFQLHLPLSSIGSLISLSRPSDNRTTDAANATLIREFFIFGLRLRLFIFVGVWSLFYLHKFRLVVLYFLLSVLYKTRKIQCE